MSRNSDRKPAEAERKTSKSQGKEQSTARSNQQLEVSIPAQLPDDLAEFVGPPPIIRGEDPQQYDRIFNRVAAAVVPADEIEWLWVRDITDAVWQGRRFQRMRDQIYELRRTVAMKQVVKTILQENACDAAIGIKPQAEKLVAEWVKNGPDGEAQMAAFLAQYGLDTGAILAEIFLGRSHVFDQLERMAAAADKRRDAVIREIERRRAGRAKPFREAADIVDAEAEDLPAKDSNRLHRARR